MYHEIGHNFVQQDWLCQAGTSHPTNDLFTLYQQEVFGEESRLVKRNGYSQVLDALADGLTWLEFSTTERLVFYRQISLAFGWDVYTQLFRFVREMPQGDRPSNDVQARCDFLYIKASEFSAHDLTTFFDHYGISITDNARNEVAAKEYPEPDPPVWTYAEN